MSRLAAALATVGTLCIGVPSPAHAAVPVALGVPVYRAADAPTSGDQVIRVELPPGVNTWRLWQSAKAMDAQVDGLTVSKGTCATTPTALCVQVVVGSFDPEEQAALAQAPIAWAGLTTYPSANERTVYLNLRTTYPEIRRQIAAHEFGHVLGLAHHTGPGVTSTTVSRTPTLSADEVAVLRDWYSTPRLTS